MKKNVQKEPIFSGNILKQPIMKNKHYFKNPKGFQNSDYTMNNGIFVGWHSKLTKKRVKLYLLKIKRFF